MAARKKTTRKKQPATNRGSHRPTQHKKAAFIAAFAECGNVSRAAEIAGIGRRSHYDWLESDTEYAAEFDEAQGKANAALEAEARRRAIEGVDEPVGFYKGVASTTVKKYSDTLLIFLMKGAMPDRYGDRMKNEHSGPNGGPIQVSDADREAAARLAAIYDREGEGLNSAPSP